MLHPYDASRNPLMKIGRRGLLGAVGLAIGSSGVAVASQMNESGGSVSEGDVALTEQEATDIATAEVDGTVLEVELEREDGTPVYEFEIESTDGTVQEVAVHADEGTVLEVETEDGDEEGEEDGKEDDEMEDTEDDREDDAEDESVPASEVSLTEAEATDIATGEVDGTVLEVELEHEDGRPVYEVEIEGTGATVSEVVVHADDGAVLDVETESEDEEAEEDEGDGDGA